MSVHICMHPFFGDIPMMDCIESFFFMAHNEQNSLWRKKTIKKLSFLVLLIVSFMFGNFQNWLEQLGHDKHYFLDLMSMDDGLWAIVHHFNTSEFL
jgi:hypothetical protein